MKLTEWQKFLEGRIWKIELEDGSVELTIEMSAEIFQGDGEASVMFIQHLYTGWESGGRDLCIN